MRDERHRRRVLPALLGEGDPIAALTLNYRPFPKQVEAHALRTPIACFFGGWGSGKTTCGGGDGIRAMANQPGKPIIAVSPTFPLQNKTMMPVLVKILPGATRWPKGRDNPRTVLGPMIKDWSASERVLTFDFGRNGTRMFFGSVSNPDSIDGGTYAYAWLDEPRMVSPEAWSTLNSRVREPGAVHRIFVSGVPAMGWMHDELNNGMPDRSSVRASCYDNPYISEAMIARLNLSGRRAQQLIWGRFVHLAGTIYDDYQPDPYIDYEQPELSDPGSLVDMQPDPNLVSDGCVDFGRRRPYAAIMQIVPGLCSNGEAGQVIVEELPGLDVLEAVHADRFARLCMRHRIKLRDVWCDPAGNTPNAQTGMKSIAIYEKALKDHGVLIGRMRWKTNPEERYITHRIDAVSAQFKGLDGVRRLFVAKHLTEPERVRSYGKDCVGIHGALLGYKYKKAPGDPRPHKDNVHDHPCDTLEYLIVGLHGVMEAPDLLAMNAPADGKPLLDEENYDEW